MAYGLSDNAIRDMESVFRQYPKIESIFLFGSRALEHHTETSDIDIAVSAPAMTAVEFASLWSDLQDLPLIYKIDCLHLDSLGNEALRKKILETGKRIY